MNASPAATGPASAGLEGVALAFGRALVSQFRPPMLLALLLPFAVALAGAIILVWLFWTPLTEWLQATLFSWSVVDQLDSMLVAVGIASLKLWLIPVVATLILLPLSGILGLVVAAVLIMPLVLRHLDRRDYPGLARRGRDATLTSVWNALWVTTVFVLGWLFTMPLWLLPPLAILLPIAWWMFAFTRMLRLDSMVEHASPDERRILLARHNRGYWTLGLICALVNLLPPAWFLLPVFSALLFSHFSLEALRRLRSGTTP
ncbi:MAG: EI24 domain-containing protein [Pigmentiphaga sp.]|uniref:EI24 domain-containing protein n=1 Tax=Pigmentiphaga sp. TaxID=1977564 RepID=UPI0029B97937|nr:EI24 domain-containing protein [Pigmentiphaga sp.]MDX3907151.1 EI24 domain-containing protein [Pigmentiphaga sp.]